MKSCTTVVFVVGVLILLFSKTSWFLARKNIFCFIKIDQVGKSMERVRGIWEMSVTSTQFCCSEPETAFLKSLFLKKDQLPWIPF